MTALAVTADDCTAFSVSKDGSIFQTDIESGKRYACACATLDFIHSYATAACKYDDSKTPTGATMPWELSHDGK